MDFYTIELLYLHVHVHVVSGQVSLNAKIAASAISTAPRLPVRTGPAKIKTVKNFSGALRGDFVKFCTRKNFPLYGIWFYNIHVYTCIYMYMYLLEVDGLL